MSFMCEANANILKISGAIAATVFVLFLLCVMARVGIASFIQHKNTRKTNRSLFTELSLRYDKEGRAI